MARRQAQSREAGAQARRAMTTAAAAAAAAPHRARRRASPSSALPLVVAVVALAFAAPAFAKKQQQQHPTGLTGTVLKLTDANFDRETAPGSPPLLFSVGAQWCPHCVALQPTLDELARALAQPSNGKKPPRRPGQEEDEDDPADNQQQQANKGSATSSSFVGVRVGKVDGPKNKVLMMRLGVQGFPTLYLVRDGRAWRYQGRGPRTAEALREFVLEGYRHAEPLPFHKSPVSVLGRAMGRAFSLPARAGAAFSSLREEGWSELQLIAAAMAVPVVVGGVVICALDAVHTRRAREAAAAAWQHEHRE